MRLLSWAKTDSGRQRTHNEDSYLVENDLHLFAVADGMGGHQGGGTASKLAMEILRREIAASAGDFSAAADLVRSKLQDTRRDTAPHTAVTDPATVLSQDPNDEGDDDKVRSDAILELPDISTVMAEAVRQAGYTIFEASARHRHLRGMGTTLTALLLHQNIMYVAHAGDSRAYHLRGETLTQLTQDHSWIRQQIDTGSMTEAEAKSSQYKHIITRSVGFERHVEVDTATVITKTGDSFLLCSDGLCNYVESRELRRILIRANDFGKLPDHLVELANKRGGDDNITIILIRVEA